MPDRNFYIHRTMDRLAERRGETIDPQFRRLLVRGRDRGAHIVAEHARCAGQRREQRGEGGRRRGDHDDRVGRGDVGKRDEAIRQRGPATGRAALDLLGGHEASVPERSELHAGVAGVDDDEHPRMVGGARRQRDAKR